jgi:hypothetical protein
LCYHARKPWLRYPRPAVSRGDTRFVPPTGTQLWRGRSLSLDIMAAIGTRKGWQTRLHQRLSDVPVTLEAVVAVYDIAVVLSRKEARKQDQLYLLTASQAECCIWHEEVQ